MVRLRLGAAVSAGAAKGIAWSWQEGDSANGGREERAARDMWKTSRSSCQLQPGRGPTAPSPGTSGRGQASLPYPNPASHLLPPQLDSILPLPFLAPLSLFSCFIVILPLDPGWAAPTLQMLPAHLPLILEPYSGAFGGNEAGKEQPLQLLFLWPFMVLADSWMNQALHHPGTWVHGTPGSNPALHPLADPQPIPILHLPRQFLHPHPTLEGFTGELQSLVSPFLGSAGLSGTPVKIHLDLQLDLLQGS